MRSVPVHGNTCHNGDCITGPGGHIPDGSIDRIITDPPYGINGDRLHQHHHRNEEFVVDGYVEFPEAERIPRPGGRSTSSRVIPASTTSTMRSGRHA
ncbi:MAG: hypothetical protein ACXQTG_06730 [Methanoculleaceae archaeon]